MQMKKMIFTGFIASILMGSGFSFAAVEDSAVLTTKQYVDDGLRYVYDKKANKEDVYTKQESDAKYLTHVDIESMDGTAYTADNGVMINNHNVELNVNAQEGSMYVYTSDGWSELPVQDEWDDGILETTSGD
jgi:hypothetical protein